MYFITSDNVKLYYEVEGEGYPLVMLPGIWADVSGYKKQVRYFKEKYQCISLDHRGIGRSDKWDGRYTFDEHARDVKQILDHRGVKRCIILGACHGGMTALTIAKKYPELCEGIVLNGTQAIKSEKQRQMFRGWKETITRTGFEHFYRSVILPVIFSEHFISSNLARLDTIAKNVARRVYPSIALKMIDACIEYGFETSELAAINVPMVMIAGDEDCFIPASAIKQACRILPNAEFILLERCGHFPQNEAADRYHELVKSFIMKLSYHGMNKAA